MTDNFEAIIVEPKKKATACVIWLHGLGANGHDFVDALPGLELPDKHDIRFIFPHAPAQPVSINGNMIMPAWYDILGLEHNSPQDEKGVKASQIRLNALINKNIKEGLSSERIILIGFSQGGALALYTALRFDQPLGGIAALSAYLPLPTKLVDEMNPVNINISIFMGHGLMDPVVSYWTGQASLEYLREAGYDPNWHAYPMEHTVNMQELADLGNWIQDMLEN
jgi:phospholipase/carboxylesterase